MVQGPLLFVVIFLSVGFVVLATAKFKLHPFLALLLAAFGLGIAAGISLQEVVKAINEGFGGLMGYIGIVIVAGTIMGKILEKSGAALRLAEVVLRVVGEKRPQVAMSLIGAIVSIPVFCDSAFVILSGLRKALAQRAKVSSASMSIALATGLYATHTLVPPTPGPIAAAGNIGAEGYLGTIILIGLVVSLPVMAAGYLWATRVASSVRTKEEGETDYRHEEVVKELGELPSAAKSFTPIFLPILLIAGGSVVAYGEWTGATAEFLLFLGNPVVALLTGVFAAFPLFPVWNGETLSGWIGEGIKDSAPILLLTGAGGAFGAVIRATPVAGLVEGFADGGSLEGVFILLIPFFVAAALKTAQGSSTAALVITSALVAPMLPQAGTEGAVPLALVVMATGAGAMAVSHVNDSYFWVVTQFSGIKVADAYKAHTMATLVQGVVAIITTMILWVVLV